MTARTIEELRTKFETGDRPTAADFVDLIDSFLHAGLSNFPNPLPAVSGKNLTNIGDALPAVLPARDASELLNISPEEYNVLTGVVPNYVSATSFNVTGDRTGQFRPGQRIRITSGGAAFYTSVDSAAYAAGPDLTTVNNLDSFPSNQLADVSLGIVSPAHLGGAVDEATVGFRRGANLTAAATLNLPADGYSFDVDGNTGIAAISARAAGRMLRLRFNGTPTLTHGAALAMRGAVNYIATAGDVLDFESLGGGNWREVGGAPGNLLQRANAWAVPIAITSGGTGAGDAATARANLGVTATGADTTYNFRANNLSDVANAATARTNLGLGSLAVLSSVAEANLNASIVSQGKLKTALNTISALGTSTGVTALAGGRYCFMPSGILGSGSGADDVGWLVGGKMFDLASGSLNAPLEDTVPTQVRFQAGYTTRGVEVTLLTHIYNGNDASNIYVQYVAACPPYNLGNGDVPIFYYGHVKNSTGKIEVLWGAEDPPFANNGPTIINPLGRIRRLVRGSLADDNGRAARIAELRRAHAMLHSDDPKDKAAVRAILDAPVTMEEKLRDMPLIPHPFSPKPGYTVILLDPCGPVVEELWLGETYGGDDTHKIIHGGKLIIDNTPCGAISPPGVMAVGCRWKVTR